MERNPKGGTFELILSMFVILLMPASFIFLLGIDFLHPIISILFSIGIFVVGSKFLLYLTQYRKPIIFSKAKVVSKEVRHGKGGYMCCIVFVFADQKKLQLQTSVYDVYNPIRIGDVLNLEYQGWWIISAKKVPDDRTQPITKSKAKIISKFSRKAGVGHMFYCATFQITRKEIRELNMTQKQFESVAVGNIVELEYQGNSVRVIKEHT